MTRDELLSRLEHLEIVLRMRGRKADALDALALSEARAALEGQKWQPIETYGSDKLNPNPVVLRPHRIHGPMDVRRLTDAERDAYRNSDTSGVLQRDIDWRWVNGDYTTMWTETAFLPYWMLRPALPT